MNVTNQDLDSFLWVCKVGSINSVRRSIDWVSGHKNFEELYLNAGLSLSASLGHTDIVSYLILKNTDLNCQLDEIRTMIASDSNVDSTGSKYAVETMLISDSAVKQYKLAFDKKTPLILAAAGGHYAIVKLLLHGGALPNLVDKNGASALAHAALNGHSNVVEQLIAADADVNQQDNEGNTPLIIALLHKKVGIAKMLVDHGADLKIENKKHANALKLSVIHNKPESVKFILGFMHYRDISYLNTGLSFSAYHGHNALVSYLIYEDPDLNCQLEEFDKKTPLILAAAGGHCDTVKLLLHYGALPNLVDKNGISALVHATLNGHSNVVGHLIAAGADVNLQDNEGLTPIMIALLSEKIEIAKILLNAGADLNARHPICGNSLIMCVAIKKLKSVEFILTCKADYGDINDIVRFENKVSLNALDCAISEQNEEMILLLKCHNACTSTQCTSVIPVLENSADNLLMHPF